MPQGRQVSTLCPKLRRGGGGRRDRNIFANGATTILALGHVLNTVGIGLFCWLIFTLAVLRCRFCGDQCRHSCWHCTAVLASSERRLIAIAAGG